MVIDLQGVQLNASEFWLSDPAVHCKDALCYRGQYKLEQAGDKAVLGSSSMQQYLPRLWSSSHTNYIQEKGYIIAKFSNIESRHETR